MSGLRQRARIDNAVAEEIAAYMARRGSLAHPSGLTEVQRVQGDARLQALAKAEWDAMDNRGNLPADWPSRRAEIEREWGA